MRAIQLAVETLGARGCNKVASEGILTFLFDSLHDVHTRSCSLLAISSKKQTVSKTFHRADFAYNFSTVFFNQPVTPLLNMQNILLTSILLVTTMTLNVIIIMLVVI